MKRRKAIWLDFIKCVRLSGIIGGALIVASGLISLAVTKANMLSTLEGIRGTLFVTGSIGLILGAAFILKKKVEEEWDYIEEWKEKYHLFSFRQVIIIISALMIMYGSLVDLLVFYYH